MIPSQEKKIFCFMIAMMPNRTLLLFSIFLLISCNGSDTQNQETSTRQESTIQSSASLYYNKEIFTVEDEGITFKRGMTIADLEAQGLEVPHEESFEMENVLVFFDKSGKIGDLSAYEGVKMSGEFNFDATKNDIFNLFQVDEEKEYAGDDSDVLTIFLHDKDSEQYERVIVPKENEGSVPNDLLLLEISFSKRDEIQDFNLYAPD